MRPRFSIAGLAAFIAFSAIAFAAIRSPSQLWASMLFALALGILPLGLLNAVYSRQRARAYWVGFTTCGALYFVATLGPWFRDEWGPRMVTTAALDLLYAQFTPASPQTTVTSWVPVNGNLAYQVAGGWPAQLNGTTATTLANDLPLSIAFAGPAPGAPPGSAAQPQPTTTPTFLYNVSTLVSSSPAPSNFKSRWDAWTAIDPNDGVGWQIGNFPLQSTAPYRRIGHSLLTFVAAAVGGAYSGRRYSKMSARALSTAAPADPA